MKQLRQVIIDTVIEEKPVIIPESIDEHGNIIPAHEVIERIEHKIVGVVYEDIPREEILSLENEASDNEPTLDERVEALESAVLEMVLGGE